MRIDAHQHFWSLARGDYGWLTPDAGPLYRDYEPRDLAPLLSRNGIDRTVVVQAAPTVAETAYLTTLAQAHEVIAGVVGWVDMAADDAPAAIRALARAPKAVGIRPMIQDIADPDWMLADALTPAFRALVDAGLTFDALVRPHHLAALHTLLRRHPDLRCVVDHGAKPRIADGLIDDWAGDIERIAAETGAYCKLSGLLTEAGRPCGLDDVAPYAGRILAAFGADRVMWGSDWPVVTLAADYDGWLAMATRLVAHLPADQQGDVFGGTARRFYGL